jgi:hypothetical protein
MTRIIPEAMQEVDITLDVYSTILYASGRIRDGL